MSLLEKHHDLPPLEVRDPDRPIPVTRRRIDYLLIGAGAAVTAVLMVAAGLLTWGSNFAEGYVGDELAAQNITFPDEGSLIGQGRDDLVKYAGQPVTTGAHAEAYASYIGGHLVDTADGATYADLGTPERAARAAVTEARENGAPDAEIEALEAEAAAITGQRDTLFKGEMLRGTLLNAYAWSTIGRIAGIAATVAFAGAVLMVTLTLLGLVRTRRPAVKATSSGTSSMR